MGDKKNPGEQWAKNMTNSLFEGADEITHRFQTGEIRKEILEDMRAVRQNNLVKSFAQREEDKSKQAESSKGAKR